MAAEFQVRLTCPDEDESENKPADAVLRFNDRVLTIRRYYKYESLALSRFYKVKDDGFWLTWKARPFKGPVILQWLLTPLCAINGILTAERDVQWIGKDTNEPILRITPLVPSEFWVDIHFKDQSDAEVVDNVLKDLWVPEIHKLAGDWLRPIRRWPELFAAPLYLIPLSMGFLGMGDFWLWGGFIAFFASVIGLMGMAVWQYNQEQRAFRKVEPGQRHDDS